MTDLGDLFGSFPNRPNHPDFWVLSDVVLQQDGVTEDKDFDFEAHLAKTVNPESLYYLANHRLGATGRQLGIPHQTMLITGLGVFIDAFLLGVNYQRKLDEKSEGEVGK